MKQDAINVMLFTSMDRGLSPRNFTFKCGGKRYTQIMAMSTNGVEDSYIAEGNIDGARPANFEFRRASGMLY